MKEEKLAVTLQYLATKESSASLMPQCGKIRTRKTSGFEHFSRSDFTTIPYFAQAACQGIYDVLAPEYMCV